MKDLPHELMSICLLAGQSILSYYQSPKTWEIQTKADYSPVTDADLQANEIITKSLKNLTPDIPILSEEGADIDYANRARWDQYWLIDPLDGTKEFIEQTGEFTINIALIENRKPVFGMVCVPVQQLYYWGDCKTNLAYKKHKNSIISVHSKSLAQRDKTDPIIVVASRRHSLENLANCLKKLENYFGVIKKESVGSALKICRVAEGSADIYPRFGPTSEWDTAAGEAVLTAAGGALFSMDFEPLSYNKNSLINPSFFAVGDMALNWQTILR